MVLLRRVIGDALRSRRQGQHRTLREVSATANVSLGYLSEIERGQKEASSELLSAVCDALGAQLSEVIREVSDTLALAEQMPEVLVPLRDDPSAEPVAPAQAGTGARQAVADAGRRPAAGDRLRKVATDGTVSVSVRQDSPLKATLRTTRPVRSAQQERDVVCAA